MENTKNKKNPEKNPFFPDFPEFRVLLEFRATFCEKNDMFRQKPEDMSKTIYLVPQNRKQNVKIQSRTLWKSFQLECTIYTIILTFNYFLTPSDIYDDGHKKNFVPNYVLMI